MRIFRTGLAALIVVAAGATGGHTAVTDGAVEAVITEARAECAAVDDGTLTLLDGAITRATLMDGAGKDAIVDFAKLECSSSKTLWCSDDGCTVALLTDGERKDIRTDEWFLWTLASGISGVIAATEGSDCGADVDECVRVLRWSEGSWRESFNR